MYPFTSRYIYIYIILLCMSIYLLCIYILIVLLSMYKYYIIDVNNIIVSILYIVFEKKKSSAQSRGLRPNQINFFISFKSLQTTFIQNNNKSILNCFIFLCYFHLLFHFLYPIFFFLFLQPCRTVKTQLIPPLITASLKFGHPQLLQGLHHLVGR